MYKTPYGLHIRAIGMNAKAAQTAGINVLRYKWSANLISGLFDGLAGASARATRPRSRFPALFSAMRRR